MFVVVVLLVLKLRWELDVWSQQWNKNRKTYTMWVARVELKSDAKNKYWLPKKRMQEPSGKVPKYASGNMRLNQEAEGNMRFKKLKGSYHVGFPDLTIGQQSLNVCFLHPFSVLLGAWHIYNSMWNLWKPVDRRLSQKLY